MSVAPRQYVLFAVMIVAVMSAVLVMMPIRVRGAGLAGLVMMVRMIVMTTGGMVVVRGVVRLSQQRF